MEFLSQYGLFLLKTVTLVFALLMTFAGFIALSRKGKTDLEVTDLNKHYETLKQHMNAKIGEKKIKKIKKKKNDKQSRLFVLEFEGDIKASQVEQLRKEITAVLAIAATGDEVLLKLDSPGGAVNAYGLAASQLERLRQARIPLTVCIDKIAASGGYLMACVANHIIAAPFAIIGSIGVVAQIPNFHRWLSKNDIDVELITAGEYKRTLTMLGKNTDKARQKFQEDLEKIHEAFRNDVFNHRKQVSIEEVATGEYWLARDALNLKLIDGLATSDEYLIQKMNTFRVFKLHIPVKQSFINKLMKPAMRFMHPWG